MRRPIVEVEGHDHAVAQRALRPAEAEAQATEAEILAFCRDQLAHYKAPKKVVFGPVPTTATGKIQKFVLRERAREFV